MKTYSRRSVMTGIAVTASAVALGPLIAEADQSTFKVGVISDEISQDFDRACSVIARDFGLQWVELRELWGKNLQILKESEIAEAQKIVAKYQLSISDIASPLFKVDWPDAPKSHYSPERDLHGAADVSYAQQEEVLARSIALARQFRTNKIRCFDFWRLDDQAPHRKAINEKLRVASQTVARQGLLLVLENEYACNTATGREAAQVLAEISSPSLALNWDPGNAVKRGELDAFPGGWNALPKNRIRHCHCKNAAKNAAGEIAWAPVGTGYVDWATQFQALRAAGFRDCVSLETHWKGGGTPEASSRISWDGMKKALLQAGAG